MSSAYPYRLLSDAVAHWAQTKPGAAACIFKGKSVTWHDLWEQIQQAARGLLALGVEPAERVALIAMPCPEFLVTYMAATQIGAIWAGFSPKFTVDELRYMLLDAQPRVLFVLGEYMGINLIEAGETLMEECPSLEHIIVIDHGAELDHSYESWISRDYSAYENLRRERTAQTQESDNAILIYTSGSTGKPKGVLHSHKNVIENIRHEVQYFGFSEDARILLHFPINHVAASVEIGYGALYAGATLVLTDRFDAQESLRLITEHGINVLGQVPAMYMLQMQTPLFEEMDWTGIRTFVWGGSTPPREMVERLWAIAQKTGARLITGYGSTELCGFVTYSRPGDSLEILCKGAGAIIPPFEVQIVDEQRRPVAPGQIGEIAVRGPSTMKGYLNNPRATAEVLDAAGWYYSRDLGYCDIHGNLFIVGRTTEMFKSGGENVFPREIEEVLESHPSVLYAAVLGIPDRVYGEVACAFVVTKPGETVTDSDLRQWCRERLANFKVPKQFIFREHLPLLPNGKVNKGALRADLSTAGDRP